MQTTSLKNKVIEWLTQGEEGISKILSLPPRQVINPLIGALLHPDESIQQQAVSVIGRVVKELAEQDLEGARIIMRRFMWMLNEESGGIGWGVPQAMAEVMVQNPLLAREYLTIFLSYLWEEGNYLEFSPIQYEVLKGLLRLIPRYKEDLIRAGAPDHLKKLLSSPDEKVRELASLALKRLGISPER